MAAAKNSKVTETSSLTWEEPPTARGGRAVSARQQEIAAALKEKPGEWAKVATGETNDGLATSIRKSTGVSFRDGVYEARSVKTGDKQYDIFARFIEAREAESK